MKIGAILEKLEEKSFEKNGELIKYYSALVTFEGERYACFINCKLKRSFVDYQRGDSIVIDIELHAFNWKPVVKYILN